jgi:hypothetical protein
MGANDISTALAHTKYFLGAQLTWPAHNIRLIMMILMGGLLWVCRHGSIWHLLLYAGDAMLAVTL